jgi:hypothetical protein
MDSSPSIDSQQADRIDQLARLLVEFSRDEPLAICSVEEMGREAVKEDLCVRKGADREVSTTAD